MQRRTFIKTVTAASLTAASYSRVVGANDRLGMALVGSGRRGRHVMGKLLSTGRTDLHILCDVWDVQRQRTKDDLQLNHVKETFALEEVLAQRDVDAVLIATPDHLHKDYAVQVLESGRHVYLEKPATLHYHEGAAIRAAVQKSGLICQTGTQQRSGTHYKQVKERFFRGSKPLGEIVFIRTQWSDFPWQRRMIEPRPMPVHFDWKRFLGPAPKVPYHWAHYDAWRNYKQYGAGILADLLTHWADVAQWMMDDATPVNAVTTGGIYFMQDDRSNPDTVNSVLQYKGGWNLTFECSIMPVRNQRASVLFHGTKGNLEIFRGGFIYTPHGKEAQFTTCETDLDLEHAVDFLDAVRDNRQPSANIDIGLQAVRPSHLAVAAYWSGKRMTWNADQSDIIVAQ